ncbi:hypothetical protein SVAN01_04951 [Stagonosporopsis vannaccii]|nr:hypothetical protein SVAN01_04951 [Stagonosporopsis vannaccii]
MDTLSRIVQAVTSQLEWPSMVHSAIAIPVLRGCAPTPLLAGLGALLLALTSLLKKKWSHLYAIYLLPGALSGAAAHSPLFDTADSLLLLWDITALLLIVAFMFLSFEDVFEWTSETLKRAKEVEWSQWWVMLLITYLLLRTFKSDAYDIQQRNASIQRMELSLNSTNKSLQECAVSCIPRAHDLSPKGLCGSRSWRMHAPFEKLRHDIFLARDVNAQGAQDGMAGHSPTFNLVDQVLNKDRVLFNFALESLRFNNDAFDEYTFRVEEAMASAALQQIRHPEASTRLKCQALTQLTTVIKDYAESSAVIDLSKAFSKLMEGFNSGDEQLRKHYSELHTYKAPQQVANNLRTVITRRSYKTNQAKLWNDVYLFYDKEIRKVEKNVRKLRDSWCEAVPAEEGDVTAAIVELFSNGYLNATRYESLCKTHTLWTGLARLSVDRFWPIVR